MKNEVSQMANGQTQGFRPAEVGVGSNSGSDTSNPKLEIWVLGSLSQDLGTDRARGYTGMLQGMKVYKPAVCLAEERLIHDERRDCRR